MERKESSMIMHCYGCKEATLCRPEDDPKLGFGWFCVKCVPLERERAVETGVGDMAYDHKAAEEWLDGYIAGTHVHPSRAACAAIRETLAFLRKQSRVTEEHRP
jgi:hypothetical protein